MVVGVTVLVLENVVGKTVAFATVAGNACDAATLVDCTVVSVEVLPLWPLVNEDSVDLETAVVGNALDVAVFIVDFTEVFCDAVDVLPLVNVTTELVGEGVVVW